MLFVLFENGTKSKQVFNIFNYILDNYQRKTLRINQSWFMTKAYKKLYGSNIL